MVEIFLFPFVHENVFSAKFMSYSTEIRPQFSVARIILAHTNNFSIFLSKFRFFFCFGRHSMGLLKVVSLFTSNVIFLFFCFVFNALRPR